MLKFDKIDFNMHQLSGTIEKRQELKSKTPIMLIIWILYYPELKLSLWKPRQSPDNFIYWSHKKKLSSQEKHIWAQIWLVWIIEIAIPAK